MKNNSKIYPIISFCLVILITFLLLSVLVPKSLKAEDPQVFVVKKGLGAVEIARELKSRNLISNEFSFLFYVFFTGRSGRLQTGGYLISPSMSIRRIAKKFVLGDRDMQKITVLEGWNLKDIGDYFESLSIIKNKDFLASVDKTLEGYLFPDTYNIDMGMDVKDILKIMKDNFDQKLSAALKKDIEKQGKKVNNIVIMASILEREVRTLDDKKIVSGILWKRM